MATPATAPVTPERIYQFAFAYAPPLVLEAAIRHHVFDVLDSGGKTLAEVSQATGASERGLAAIMNMLVGFDFLAKDAQGNYTLTPESSAFLVSTKPSFQGGLIRHTSEHLLPRWLELEPGGRHRTARFVGQSAGAGQPLLRRVCQRHPPHELPRNSGAGRASRLEFRLHAGQRARSCRRLRRVGHCAWPATAATFE